MKWVVCLLVVSQAAVETEVRKVDKAGKAYKYGPEHCVSLTRSAAGTCVIETDCAAPDIQNFTFDFICTDGVGTKVQHSFGEGNFDPKENFDTGVTCAECEPTEGGVLVETKSEEGETKAAAPEANVPPSDAAFYGPGGCVATYRSGAGTCVIQTRCTGKDTTEYNFGLTCVDAEGSTTRHLFGVNSFDPEETFDTLVECKLCLGLDGDDAAKNVTALTKDVQALQGEMKEIQADVATIMKELDLKTTAPTEAPAAEDEAPAEESSGEEAAAEESGEEAAAEEETTAAPEGFLHQKRHHKKKASHAARKVEVRRHHSHKAKPKRHADVDEDDDASLDSELSDADLSID